MTTFPLLLLHVDAHTPEPETGRDSVAGWIVSQERIEAVQAPANDPPQAFEFFVRPDVAAALPMYPHVVGFRSTMAKEAIREGTLRVEVTITGRIHACAAAVTSEAKSRRPAVEINHACPACGEVLPRGVRLCPACDVTLVSEDNVFPGRWGATPDTPAQTRRLLETHTHEALTAQHLSGTGVEIGAFQDPIPGIRPIYVDRFAEYGGVRTLAQYHGDATELPFFTSSLGYVATSHVLEHVANPLAALREWHRVVKPGGLIYLVVPDRRLTFDRTRALTPPEHMLDDFRHGVTPADGTHIDDFVFGVDWPMYAQETPEAEAIETRVFRAAAYHRAIREGGEINIHFHTFELPSLVALIELGNRHQVWPGRIAVVEHRFAFPASRPDGILIVARVEKRWPARVAARFGRKGLLPSARGF